MTGPERSRRWALELLLIAASFVTVGTTLIGGQILAHPRNWDWGTVLGYCIPAVGGFLGAFVGRRLKGAEQRRREAAVTRAMWTGVLPRGADPAEWRPYLRSQKQGATVAGWALLVLGVAGGGITVAAAVRTGHDHVGLWVLAAVQEIAAGALIWACIRLARRGRRLLVEMANGAKS